MKKQILFLTIISFTVLASCKKEEPKTNPPSNGVPTIQTQVLPVYLSDIVLNTYFGGNAPMIRITESGTTNQVTFLVNTCSSTNGNTFTIYYGKSYNIVFGVYVDGTWAQWSGFSGIMTVASDGQISGIIGVGIEQLSAVKANNYGGCGTAISGDILLFY